MKKLHAFRILLTLTFGLFGSSQLRAHLGLGNLVTHTAKYQIDKKGHRSYFNLGPYVSVNYNFKMPALRHEFIPELGLALHSKPSPHHSKYTFFFLYPLAWEVVDQHFFRYGLGNFISSVTGPGGSTVLENGSSFAEYYRPGASRYAHNGALLLGYEYRFREGKFGVRLDFYSIAFLSKNRTTGYAGSFNVYYF
jgi:hypothetical protein